MPADQIDEIHGLHRTRRLANAAVIGAYYLTVASTVGAVLIATAISANAHGGGGGGGGGGGSSSSSSSSGGGTGGGGAGAGGGGGGVGCYWSPRYDHVICR